jgi:6-phosphofructokinase 1
LCARSAPTQSEQNQRTRAVAHSGGPSSVVNASLLGIVEQARRHPEIATAYGARFGIEGVLEEDFAGSGSAHQTLRVTPAMEAGIVDADHV